MSLGCEFSGEFRHKSQIHSESEKFLKNEFREIGKFVVYVDPNLAEVDLKIDEKSLKGRAKELLLEGLEQEKESIRSKMIEESRKTFKNASDVFTYVSQHKDDVLDIMYFSPQTKDKIIGKLIHLLSEIENEEKTNSIFESLSFKASHSGQNKVEWATKIVNEMISKHESGTTTIDKFKLKRLENLFQKHEWLTDKEASEINHTLTRAAYEFWRLYDQNNFEGLEDSTLVKCLTTSISGWLHMKVGSSSNEKLPWYEWKPDGKKVLRLHHLLSFIFMREAHFKSSDRCKYFREFCMKSIFMILTKNQIDEFLKNYIAKFNVLDIDKNLYLNDLNLILRSIPLETYFEKYGSWKWTQKTSYEDRLFLSALYYLESLKNNHRESMMIANTALEDSITLIRWLEKPSGTPDEILQSRLTPEEFQLLFENFNLTSVESESAQSTPPVGRQCKIPPFRHRKVPPPLKDFFYEK